MEQRDLGDSRSSFDSFTLSSDNLDFRMLPALGDESRLTGASWGREEDRFGSKASVEGNAAQVTEWRDREEMSASLSFSDLTSTSCSDGEGEEDAHEAESPRHEEVRVEPTVKQSRKRRIAVLSPGCVEPAIARRERGGEEEEEEFEVLSRLVHRVLRKENTDDDVARDRFGYLPDLGSLLTPAQR